MTPTIQPKKVLLFRLLLSVGIISLGVLLAFGLLRTVDAMAKSNQREEPGSSIIFATDLQVDTESSEEFVLPGNSITYTIWYTNATASTINDVTIYDSLSAGQIFDENYTAIPPIPTEYFTTTSDLDMTWQLPSLGAHTSGVIYFSVNISTSLQPANEEAPILVGNSVLITTTTPGVSTGFDSAVAMVQGPVLRLYKTASHEEIYPGHHLTYALSLTNEARIDSIDANNIRVEDVMPEYSTFITASHNGYYSGTIDAIVWNIPGPISPGSTELITFSVEVLETVDTSRSRTIKNEEEEFTAQSAEMLAGPIEGEKKANVKIIPLFEKVAETQWQKFGKPAAFPGQNITYTIAVHNPKPFPLTNVTVNDILPGDPEPFTYLGPVYGSPPPDLISPDGRILTWTVDLPAWGVITRSFVTNVPTYTLIEHNDDYTEYKNTLIGEHPEAYFHPNSKLAVVRVYSPLKMRKDVTPDHGQVGTFVTYTLTIENIATFPVTDITLTDTMIGPQFSFVSMLVGPDPLPAYSDNPIVWKGLHVNPGQTLRLDFVAQIDGAWLVKYGNNLCATSPTSYIPCRIDKAKVEIDPSLGLDKTVTPGMAFIGDTVQYDFWITNISTQTVSMDIIEDYLEEGFEETGGGNPATIYFTPDEDILPGGQWTGSINVDVTEDLDCSDLPHTYKNEKGSVWVHVTSPWDTWVTNASDYAPLLVNPHIIVDLIPYRKYVLPGESFIYNLRLENISPTDYLGQIFSLQLQPDLVYSTTLSGLAPTSVTTTEDGDLLAWNGIDFTTGTVYDIQILVEVPEGIELGKKFSSFSFVESGNVCFQTPKNNVSGIDIVDPAVGWLQLSKKLDREVTSVSPLEEVEFDIKINNDDIYSITLTLTDTMPLGFSFVKMGPTDPYPTVQGNKLVWENFVVQGNKSRRLTLFLRAGVLFGSYKNILEADQNTTTIHAAESEYVNVVPEVDLSKIVTPNYANSGETVIYTITLLSLSDQIFENITITDTLPANFAYVSMVQGDSPDQINLGNTQLVWEEITLGAHSEMVFSFEVQISNTVLDGVYYNNLSASSPNVFVSGIDQTAPVTVTAYIEYHYFPLVIRNSSP